MTDRENSPDDQAPENLGETPGTPKQRPHRSTSQGFRDQRASALNAALRENLRRRKQAAQSETADSQGPDDAHDNAKGDGTPKR